MDSKDLGGCLKQWAVCIPIYTLRVFPHTQTCIIFRFFTSTKYITALCSMPEFWALLHYAFNEWSKDYMHTGTSTPYHFMDSYVTATKWPVSRSYPLWVCWTKVYFLSGTRETAPSCQDIWMLTNSLYLNPLNSFRPDLPQIIDIVNGRESLLC